MKLTSLVKTSGCGSKIKSNSLRKYIKKLKPYLNENLIVGFETNDDALI